MKEGFNLNNVKPNSKREVISLDDILGGSPEQLSGLEPVMYAYYKGLMERTIILNADIDTSILEYAVLPLRRMAEDGTGKPIKLIISTYGGNVWDGFNLVDTIEKIKCPLITQCEGISASMGTYILMAGKNNPNVHRVANKYSVGLLHSGSTTLDGAVDKIDDLYDFNKKYEDKIKQFVLDNSTMTSEFYDGLKRVEFWMSAEDMLKYGMIDEII